MRDRAARAIAIAALTVTMTAGGSVAGAATPTTCNAALQVLVADQAALKADTAAVKKQTAAVKRQTAAVKKAKAGVKKAKRASKARRRAAAKRLTQARGRLKKAQAALGKARVKALADTAKLQRDKELGTTLCTPGY